MIVLCCDPGLRNLSFCIMNSEYEILLWNTFNILDSDDHHCSESFKNGKLCGRKCNMKYIKKEELELGLDLDQTKIVKTSSSTVFTCKTHFPKEIKKTNRHLPAF